MDNNELRDRRLTRRYEASVPLKFRLWKSAMPEVPGESLNISESGIYFVTHGMVAEGETVEVRFEMPEAVVGEPATEWLCTGQVFRLHRIGVVWLGVGVRFECYEVSKPQGTTTTCLGAPLFRFGWFSRLPEPRTRRILDTRNVAANHGTPRHSGG